MNRFVVGIEGAQPDHEEAFRKWITDNGLGFWHWIPHFWILHSLYGTHTVISLRDKIMQLFPTMNIVVIEIKGNPVMWSGYGPNQPDHNMFTWLKQNMD